MTNMLTKVVSRINTEPTEARLNDAIATLAALYWKHPQEFGKAIARLRQIRNEIQRGND